MAKYRMEDGTVINTDSASRSWEETTDWNGSNHIGRSSGSQWHDQTLYRSRKGRYYIEFHSRVTGEGDHVEWVSPQEATRWLLVNDEELPEDLKQHEEAISE